MPLVDSTYNQYGDVTSTSSAAGRTTYFDYGINGNQVATWYFAVRQAFQPEPLEQEQILDVTHYDESNRVTDTRRLVLPEGHHLTADLAAIDFTLTAYAEHTLWATGTQYNAAGQTVRTTDQQGLATETTYDTRGQTIQTRIESRTVSQETAWLLSRTYYDPKGRAVVTTSSFVEDKQPGQAFDNTTATAATFSVYDGADSVVETYQLKNVTIAIVETLPGNPNSYQTELRVGTATFTPPTVAAPGEQLHETYFRELTQFFTTNGAIVISSSQTVYDNASRVTSSFDQYGAETRTTYNRFGEVIQTATLVTRSVSEGSSGQGSGTELVWLVSRTIYDALGRAEYTIDRFELPYDEQAEPGATGSPTADSPPVYATRTIYDGQGRVVRTQRLKDVIVTITDPSENPASQVHDPGTIVSSTQTNYNTKGQVARSIAADGQVTDYEYDSLGRQTATIGHPAPAESVGMVQHAGYLVRHRTETLYDTQGRVATQLANIIQVETAAGALIAIDRTAAQSTSYTYDRFGNRTTTTFTDGSYIQVRYDDFGRQLAEMQQTAALYLTGWSDTANSFVVTGWDADQDGQPDGTQPPNTLDLDTPIPTKLFEYDSQSRLAAVLLPAVPDPQNDNQLTRPRYEYGYDAQGNHVLIRDPLGRETWLTYGPSGEQLTRTLPLGFGPDGIRGTEDDGDLPEGVFTEEFRYDDQQRQVLHVSFEGVVAQAVYDPATGRRAETLFFDNLTQYAGGSEQASEVWTYAYDAFGREVEVTQDDGTTSRTVQKTYDPQGRLVAVRTDEGVVTYSYDALGRKTEMKVFAPGADPGNDPPERVTSYGYDDLGRLKSVIESAGSDPNSRTLATVYTYDILGNLSRADLPNGVVTVYAYDSLNRLTELTHYEPEEPGLLDPEHLDTDLSNNQPRARFAYIVRADGKRTSATETFWVNADSDPQTAPTPHVNRIDWTYDDVGRLTDEVFNHFYDDLDQIESFVYDLVGNRREKWLNTDPQFNANGVPTDTIADELVASLYDANDRLSEARDYTAPDPPDPQAPAWTAQDGTHVQTTTYAYAHTQQTVKELSTATGQPVSKLLFDYDLQGRLSKATTEAFTGGTLSSRERVTYDYDATGIRVSALNEIDTVLHPTVENWQFASRTEFLVDHHNFTGYQQVIRETTYDAQGEITKTIEYTIGLDEIAQTVTPYVDGEADPESAQTHIFAHDGHGSVRVLFDLSAAIAQLYAFDAYGQLLGIHTGAAQFVSDLPADALTTLHYSGEHFDAKLAMQYLRARYYDPATARFSRLDPFFGTANDPLSLHKYLYVHADPIQGIDPTGLLFIDDLSLQGIVAHFAFSLLVSLVRPAAETNLTLGTLFPSLGGTLYALLKPDVVDRDAREYYELKPVRHKHRTDLQAVDAAQMIGYDFVLGIGFGYHRGDSPTLLGQIPVGGLFPAVIITPSETYSLKFWAADDPMSGGFDGKGFVWYKVDKISKPPRRVPDPAVERERVYEGEPVRVRVWHPDFAPLLDANQQIDILTQTAFVGIIGGLTLVTSMAVMNSLMAGAL